MHLKDYNEVPKVSVNGEKLTIFIYIIKQLIWETH